jgi:hypothetical protein
MISLGMGLLFLALAEMLNVVAGKMEERSVGFDGGGDTRCRITSISTRLAWDFLSARDQPDSGLQFCTRLQNVDVKDGDVGAVDVSTWYVAVANREYEVEEIALYVGSVPVNVEGSRPGTVKSKITS